MGVRLAAARLQSGRLLTVVGPCDRYDSVQISIEAGSENPLGFGEPVGLFARRRGAASGTGGVESCRIVGAGPGQTLARKSGSGSRPLRQAGAG